MYRTSNFRNGGLSMDTIFKNGLVYSSGMREFIHTDLLVRDGKIVDTSFHGDADNMTVVDCSALYILPGLVDVHTHGRAGFDFNTADVNDIRTMRRSYAKAGTTTVMATLASAEMNSLVSSTKAIQQNRSFEDGLANIAGIHLEGRYLNPKKRGAHAENLIFPLNSSELTGLMELMLPTPVHISAAVELDGGEDFVKAALSPGATVSLAHSNATYEEAMQAIEWGVTGFTHTFNAMRPLHHREPGNSAASLLCDTAYSEFICDGEHIHPAMIKLASRMKPDDKLVLITDSMEATGCPDGEYSIAGQPVFVKNGRAVNIDGALAGSTLDLFTALVNYMKFADKTLEEAIPCATSNPAAMVGTDNICGSIREGLRADFIMLRDKSSPEIESVWIAGKLI